MFSKSSLLSGGRQVPDVIPEIDYYERSNAGGFTRGSDTTITVTDNATNQGIFIAGYPIVYKDSTDLYGMIKSYSSGTVTICGPALPSTINSFKIGPAYKVANIAFYVSGALTVEDDKLLTVMKTAYYWGGPKAYFVRGRAFVNTAAAGANLQIMFARSSAATNLLSSVLDLGTSTSVAETTTNISTTNYLTYLDDKIFLNVDQIGSSTAGSDLSVYMYWVFP